MNKNCQQFFYNEFPKNFNLIDDLSYFISGLGTQTGVFLYNLTYLHNWDIT